MTDRNSSTKNSKKTATKKSVKSKKVPRNNFPALKTALDQIHIEVDRSLFLNEREDIASKEEAISVRREISIRLLKSIEWISRVEQLLSGITTLS